VANVKTLQERGFVVVAPDEGRMTGSDIGIGRYPEVNKIIEIINLTAHITADLAGKKLLITAGGTREPIDPIRFIGNRSSGRQGFALAAAAASRGAQVHLIAANTDLPVIEGVTITSVETADQMAAVLEYEFSECDALIMSAAVADAKVANYSDQKIKKENLDVVSFSKNPDILKNLSEKKKPGQVIVGFAAETIAGLSELQKRGEEKLASKSLDLIYVNNVSDGAVFGSENTQGLIIDKNHNVIKVPQISKDTLSDILLDQLVSKLG
jgi:phosphopantothenoylcysteine decarboxylase/phosphopantothenate--cysteine ligase